MRRIYRSGANPARNYGLWLTTRSENLIIRKASRVSSPLEWPMIRRPLIAMCLFLLATATARTEPPTEAELAKLIVGKWAGEEMINGLMIKSTTTYQRGGVMTVEAVATKHGISLIISASGKWKVSGSKLTEIWEKANPPRAISAGETTDEILEINDKICRYKTAKGDVRTKTRVAN